MPNLITPPPELVQQWHKEACKDPYHGGTFFESKTLKHVATQAARWGADQELKACCEVLARELICDGKHVATDLRMIRRPKPPTLKEQAIEALDRLCVNHLQTTDHEKTIRRALEALPND